MREDRVMENKDRLWLANHGPQILELVSTSGMAPYDALRVLIAMATGYPCSSPPRWCETGCKHWDTETGCAHIKVNPDGTYPPKFDAVERWSSLHQWDLPPPGEPRWGVLADCPGFEPKEQGR